MLKTASLQQKDIKTIYKKAEYKVQNYTTKAVGKPTAFSIGGDEEI